MPARVQAEGRIDGSGETVVTEGGTAGESGGKVEVDGGVDDGAVRQMTMKIRKRLRAVQPSLS